MLVASYPVMSGSEEKDFKPARTFCEISSSCEDFQTPGKRPKTDETAFVETIKPETECPVCLECWTNTGNHQLCVSSCGHCFGYNCIVDCLKQSNKCPICQGAITKKGLIKLRGVASGLFVRDVTEINDLKKKQEENRKEKFLLDKQIVGYENQIIALQKQAASESVQRSQQQSHQQSSQSSQCSQSPQPQASSSSTTFSLFESDGQQMQISQLGLARVLAVSDYNAQIAVSTEIYGDKDQHGIFVVDLETSAKTLLQTGTYNKAIRDMSYQQGNNNLLSVCLDKSAAISDIRTNQPARKMELSKPGWSCSWNQHQPFIFHCGLAGGQIVTFDSRNHETPLSVLSSPCSVVSLHAFRNQDLMAATLQGVGIFKGNCNGRWEPEFNCLEFAGNSSGCVYASVAADDSVCMATYRPRSDLPFVQHINFSVKKQRSRANFRLQGGKKMASLSRSTVFVNDCNIYFSASNHSNQTVDIWNLANRQLVQSIPIFDRPCLDIKFLAGKNGPHMLCLTEKSIYAFKAP